MLTQRQSLLAKLLITQNGYKTLKYYAQELNISERTVHSDLEKISNSLLEQGYVLDRKPGIGIAIKKTDKTTIESKVRTVTLSKFNRRKKIIELILLEGKTVTFEHLATLFLVSKSSIENDIKFIKKLLTTNNNLHVISDSLGTRLLGSEKDIQKAYLIFNFFIFDASLRIQDDENEKLSILIQYYGEKNVTTCFNVLYSHVRSDNNFIAEYYLFNVLNMLVIIVHRAQNGYHIDDIITDNDNLNVFKNSAKLLLKKISLQLSVTFIDADIHYLSMYLLSNRINVFSSNKNDISLVEKMISAIGSSLYMDFSQDTKLRDHLIQHIPPMLYRLKEGIKINNPFVYQVKKDFSVLFNLIWIVTSECEGELNIAFNEDEIAFLTIHFQSAIERAKLNKKILVVCQNGVATTELLVNRITSIVPSLTTIEVASINELSRLNLADFDLIISTVNLTLENAKVIVVSPLLSEQDIRNIFDIYNENFVFNASEKENEYPLLNLKNYIESDAIFLNQNYNSKDELITAVGEKLVERQIVFPEFVDGMLVRETAGGTDLPTGVAIPHGSPKFVKQTVIVMVTNEKAIKWNEHLVKMVIIICVAEKDKTELKKILADIYTLVKDKYLINQLGEISNNQKFINYIKGVQQ